MALWCNAIASNGLAAIKKEMTMFGTRSSSVDASVGNAVPMAQELADDQLDALFGGLPNVCGCGYICSFTGECGCDNGVTVCGC